MEQITSVPAQRRPHRTGVVVESLTRRFGQVTCFFCGREWGPEGRTRFILEPHDEPGIYRARCRVACNGVPFVVPKRVLT